MRLGFATKFVGNVDEEFVQVFETGGFAMDALGADLLGGVELQGGSRTGEYQNGDVAQGRFLLADPFDEFDAAFVFHAEVSEDDFGHGVFGAVRIHAGAFQIGFGFADVAADGGRGTFGRG